MCIAYDEVSAMCVCASVVLDYASFPVSVSYKERQCVWVFFFYVFASTGQEVCVHVCLPVWVCILGHTSWRAAWIAWGGISLYKTSHSNVRALGEVFSSTHLITENITAEGWVGSTLWHTNQRLCQCYFSNNILYLELHLFFFQSFLHLTHLDPYFN